MAENKAGAAKYSRWENRADGNDSDPGKTDYGTASRGTVQRFSLPQPDKPSKGLFAKSQQLNREPLYVEKETRYRNNVASLPEHFGGPVYSSSKWGHYIQTEKYNQYQDVSDYGMYEQDGTGSDLLTGDKFYIDNKTNDKNVPSLEREYQTKFGYENDNVEDVYWNTIQYSKKKTEAVTSISLRNEQNQISENSSRQKLALDADNIGSKWSKFMIEEHDHVSDEDDNDDTIYTSESCQAYDSMDKIHHPLTELDRNKIHFPLRELDRNQVKRDTTASEEGVRHTDFPSKLFTKTNFSSSESKHTKLTLQPKGNVANCLQEARSLFTVGELSDDDLNL